MALKLNFREITPEDTEILRMVALRKEKAEDHLCCDVTNEDGVTQTTWYSKADVALWGEDYICLLYTSLDEMQRGKERVNRVKEDAQK